MKGKRYITVMVIIAIAVPLSIVLGLTMANHPPRIDSLQAESGRVFPSESTQIVCAVSAPDRAVLSYEWSVSGGEIHGEGATVAWMAPDSEGFYYISVNVTDGRGREVTDHIMITVKANLPPIINNLTTDADWTTPGASLRVMCDAEDYDGHPLSYDWSASAGYFEGTGPEVTWVAPEDIGMYEITVVVSDDYGGWATGTLHPSVTLGEPPDIEALLVTATHKYLREVVYSERYQVGEEKTFSIECIASHPDGVALSYEWECDAGEISDDSEDGSLVKWTAPTVRDPVAVTVTVSDPVGNMVRRSVILEVVRCSVFG